MIDKCANPTCAAQFRYLHQGKLFLVDGTREPVMCCVEETNGVRAVSGRTLVYWLCDACSKTMVVVVTSRNSIDVVPRATPPDEASSPSKTTLAPGYDGSARTD